MKRLFDIVLSMIVMIIAFPMIFIFAILIFLEDKNNPFYLADRVGKNFKIFKMIKLRSMSVNDNNANFGSTKSDDIRITKMGSFVRKFKLDEIVQVINVFYGQMSFVGPRPNIIKDVNLYTEEEKKLLLVKPGITDFSSIIFSDEANILEGSNQPDIKYNQVIRPWKSRLGLIYVKNKNFSLDIKLIFLTIIAIINKKIALKLVIHELKKLKVDNKLIRVCKREKKLESFPPPGTNKVFQSYSDHV
tara:strand:- start:675 stop:1412 length:738 start_codon:yes stop_codon:yes gene_type:complete